MSDSDEITGVRSLPIAVRPWAVSMSERHRQVKEKVDKMQPMVEEMHSDIKSVKFTAKIIAWAIGLLAAVGGGHLAWIGWHH